MNTRQTGNISEAKIIAKFLELGYIVSQPFGNSDRYDLVVDDGNKLIKVQCKTARLGDGVLKFMAYSSHQNGKEVVKENYLGQIDKFAVYSPDLDKVYLIPVGECNVTECYLRVELPKLHGNKNTIRWASDYEI